MTRPVVDQAPLSEFIRKMRAVFARRLKAMDVGQKRGLEREMEVLMREYLGRSAWDAAALAEEQQAAAVPRDTSGDHDCHSEASSLTAPTEPARVGADVRDGKSAGAGREAD